MCLIRDEQYSWLHFRLFNVKNPKKKRGAQEHTQSLRTAFDAAVKTDEGKVLVIQAKGIGKRVTSMRELAHGTIMEMTKTTYWYKKRFYELMKERKGGNRPTVKHPYDLFMAAKPVLREIAIKGDKEYHEMAKTDEDFDNIRDDSRFKKLIE